MHHLDSGAGIVGKCLILQSLRHDLDPPDVDSHPVPRHVHEIRPAARIRQRAGCGTTVGRRHPGSGRIMITKEWATLQSDPGGFPLSFRFRSDNPHMKTPLSGTSRRDGHANATPFSGWGTSAPLSPPGLSMDAGPSDCFVQRARHRDSTPTGRSGTERIPCPVPAAGISRDSP